jgi:hypothetical protein
MTLVFLHERYFLLSMAKYMLVFTCTATVFNVNKIIRFQHVDWGINGQSLPGNDFLHVEIWGFKVKKAEYRVLLNAPSLVANFHASIGGIMQ